MDIELIEISPGLRRLAATAVVDHAPGVRSDLHREDFIFQFVMTHPDLETSERAMEYYFVDGQKSARQLAALCKDLGFGLRHSKGRKMRLLEFASGYGCVTRHLSDAIPYAEIVSSDIHPAAMDFIGFALNGEVAQSHSVPEQFEPGGTYDVIFSLSFYSHMPETSWMRWLRAHYDALNAGGFLIFTTQGLASREHFEYPTIPESGFWFVPDSEQKDLDVYEYGQTIVTQAWVEGQLRALPGATLERFEEAAWWGHQDLYVVKKPG